MISALLIVGSALAGPATASRPNPFAQFSLPDSWEERFWESPNAKALFRLSPKAVASLVPEQGGVRFCRCPACNASEADDPMSWSVEHPKELTCRLCGVTVPNDRFPAHEEKKPVPEDTVEVAPGVIHHYPYHAVEAEHQRYPDERLYLSAKADDQARAFLAKAALYAAVRYHEQAPGQKDAALARIACVIVLRFAQVYPTYATRYDQPGFPKYFQQADLAPPYRRNYGTGKWEWTGSQNVPLNLVVAYALLRDDPALGEAGRLLNEADPRSAVERHLFRAAVEFVRRQPEEYSEESLQAYRGILAVGRLLDDPALVQDALARLERFSARGFHHDGFWRDGSVSAHRRVVGQLDGWIDRLLAGSTDSSGHDKLPMIALARVAGSAALADSHVTEIEQAAFPTPNVRSIPRSATLLGGTGLARLAVGRGADALDVELRGLRSTSPARIERQALRLAVGGRTALDDLTEVPGLSSGYDCATVSHNTVVVDGINQRESLGRAQRPAAAGNFVFFAADPDFQVVTLDDPRSYPQSTTRYRQTIVVAAGARSRYALSVFEVHGGLQHDQFFHAPAGSTLRWRLSVPAQARPETLLSPGLTFVPSAPAEDGRWFVQAYGELDQQSQGAVTRPAQAWCVGLGGVQGSVRLHLLGDLPLSAITFTEPDPLASARHVESGRGGLLLRRRSSDGSTLKTTFVTLFEPVSSAIAPVARAGRVASPPGTVVVLVETSDGPEHLVVNLAPGTTQKVALGDGRILATDGLAVWVASSGLVLAGGSFADCGGLSVKQRPAAGRIMRSERRRTSGSLGWFETDGQVPDLDQLAGRILLIRHGDGTTHGWTLQRAENLARSARIFIREEPGFEIERASGAGIFYQFPESAVPGPHTFGISRIARGSLH
jgi:hypothetical protein